jgi:hypothetical protein
MPVDPRMQAFLELMSSAVVNNMGPVISQIAEAVATRTKAEPPRQYAVTRTGVDGEKRPQAISPTQAVCELTDEMKRNTAVMVELRKIMAKNYMATRRAISLQKKLMKSKP